MTTRLTRRRWLRLGPALAMLGVSAACGGPRSSPLPTAERASGATPSVAPVVTATLGPPATPTTVAGGQAGGRSESAATLAPPSPAVVASATLLLGPPTPVVTPQPTSRLMGSELPLFDTHAHYSEDAWGPIPIDQALRLMEQAGTRLALVSSTPDTGTVRLYQAAPTRIVPILRPYRTRADLGTWHRDPTIPAYLAERLTLGVHRGIGELHLNGEEARSAVVNEVATLAATRQLFLHAHSDDRAVERLFEVEPRSRILWAHAGFTDAAGVQRMVERYPSLWVEFAFRSDIASNGQLDPSWQALLTRYPERFMVGSDSYTVQRWQAMPTILGEVRRWCQRLPPAIGEQIAWRNAAHLFGIDPAVFR